MSFTNITLFLLDTQNKSVISAVDKDGKKLKNISINASHFFASDSTNHIPVYNSALRPLYIKHKNHLHTYGYYMLSDIKQVEDLKANYFDWNTIDKVSLDYQQINTEIILHELLLLKSIDLNLNDKMHIWSLLYNIYYDNDYKQLLFLPMQSQSKNFKNMKMLNYITNHSDDIYINIQKTIFVKYKNISRNDVIMQYIQQNFNRLKPGEYYLVRFSKLTDNNLFFRPYDSINSKFDVVIQYLQKNTANYFIYITNINQNHVLNKERWILFSEIKDREYRLIVNIPGYYNLYKYVSSSYKSLELKSTPLQNCTSCSLDKVHKELLHKKTKNVTEIDKQNKAHKHQEQSVLKLVKYSKKNRQWKKVTTNNHIIYHNQNNMYDGLLYKLIEMFDHLQYDGQEFKHLNEFTLTNITKINEDNVYMLFGIISKITWVFHNFKCRFSVKIYQSAENHPIIITVDPNTIVWPDRYFELSANTIIDSYIINIPGKASIQQSYNKLIDKKMYLKHILIPKKQLYDKFMKKWELHKDILWIKDPYKCMFNVNKNKNESSYFYEQYCSKLH